MSGLARNSSTLRLISKNGKLCTKCCGPPPGYEPDLCCPGFGDNQTPTFYTAHIEGVEDCPVRSGDGTQVNGAWKLELTEHHGGTKCEPFPWQTNDECLCVHN